MNVGFDAKRLFSNYTGLGNYSRTLVKNLSIYHPENEYHLYAPKLKENEETNYFIKSPNIYNHRSKAIFKSLWRSFLPKQELANNKIDIYHGLSHELPFGIRDKAVKSVVTIHDLIFKVYPDTYPFVDRLIYDYKFRYSCEAADVIIAISENTKKDIVKWYQIPEEKIQVVYQSCSQVFIDDDVLDPSQVLKKYFLPKDYLLYVGAVTERKNVHTLLKAYSMLKEDQRPALVIVGQGKTYLEKCIKQSHDLGIANDVIWINNLSNNHELKVLYQNALAFVYPSIYEGFGIPIIEAMFSNTPVVSSSSSCLMEAGGEDSLYFDPNSHLDLRTKLQRIIDDGNLRDQMRKSGMKHVMGRFSPQNVSGQLIGLYKSLLR